MICDHHRRLIGGSDGHVGLTLSFVPGLAMLRSYQPRWLSKDLTAGLILTAPLVRTAMAYAELAGLPPITGLR